MYRASKTIFRYSGLLVNWSFCSLRKIKMFLTVLKNLLLEANRLVFGSPYLYILLRKLLFFERNKKISYFSWSPIPGCYTVLGLECPFQERCIES